MRGVVAPPRDERTIVALADLNRLEANRELTRRAGGTVVDEDGLAFWLAVHPLPVLVNAVVRTDPRVPAQSVLERAGRFFASHGRGFSVMLHGSGDDDLAAACEAAGLPRVGDAPGMVLERRLADAVPPDGVGLRVVETAADAAEFARVNGEAYATYGMPADCAPAIVGRLDVLRAPHIVSVLATVDGRAAAAAMVMLTHGVGGVYWVGTTPAARGRGLAELCTRAVGNVAVDMGASLVVLQASVMGEPVYRRMGYREVTRYPSYARMRP
jgi:hypothetical protein